jgi:hypothetical protein
MSKKYHIIYKVTNLINGKIYIGKHSTNNIHDNYLGSGTALLSAVDKYGKENFKKEILSYHSTSEEALIEEALLVTPDFILRSDTYNIVVGGGGCKDYYIESRSAKISKHAKNKVVVKDENGNTYKVDVNDQRYVSGELIHISKHVHKHKSFEEIYGEETATKLRNNISKCMKERLRKNPPTKDKNGMFNKKHTKSTREKISRERIEKELAKGENNPMYGNGYKVSGEKNGMFGVKSKWMYKIIDDDTFIRKYVKLDEVNVYILNNWKYGMKPSKGMKNER